MQNKFLRLGVPATKSGTADGRLAALQNGIVAAPSNLIGNRIAVGNANGITAKQRNLLNAAASNLIGNQIAIGNANGMTVKQQSGIGRIIAKRSGAMAAGAGRDVGQRIAPADTIAPGKDAQNIVASAVINASADTIAPGRDVRNPVASAVMNVKAAPKATKLRTVAPAAGLTITDVPAIRGNENTVTRAVLAVRAITISAGEQHRLATTVVKTMPVN
ncbi:hypothetical protein KKH63_02130 [Patescibacteria group bacterium]|nr:hypothetical protein [Patescibacteria group bacterium]